MFNTEKHKFHIIKILEAIYSNSNLAPILGFKGGTAAYLFYDLPRFSVDLDFDIVLLEKDYEQLPSVTELIQNEFDKLLGSTYKIKDKSLKLNTLFWLISYEKNEMNIKIEINTRKFPNTYEPKSFYGSTVQLLVIGDMIAHKLVATIDRKVPASRRSFDIDFFLKSKYASEINYNIVKFRTGLETNEFYEKLLKYINNYNEKNLLNGLGELITESQKNWVKDKLLRELQNLIQMQVDINKNSIKA